MKTNKNQYILIICLYLFVLQNVIEQYFPILKYWDEFFAVLCLPLVFAKLILQNGKVKVDRLFLRMVYLLGAFLVVGLLSSILGRHQPMKYVIAQSILYMKFYLAILSSYLLFQNKIDSSKFKLLERSCRIIPVVFCLFYAMDIVFNLFASEVRYGIKSAQIFYGHPTNLAAICGALSVILIICGSRKNLKYICINLFLMIMTMRSKAIATAILIAILYFFVSYRKKEVKLNKWVIIAIIAFVTAWDQIINYYILYWDRGARSVLTLKSLQIAKDFFPMGSGFATFASYYSTVNFSPLYFLYGISSYGQMNQGHFLVDVFWPTVTAETGYVGLLLYVLVLLTLFLMIKRLFAENRDFYLAGMVCFVYLIISSTAEAAFLHPIAIPFAFALGIIFGNSSKKEV